MRSAAYPPASMTCTSAGPVPPLPRRLTSLIRVTQSTDGNLRSFSICPRTDSALPPPIEGVGGTSAFPLCLLGAKGGTFLPLALVKVRNLQGFGESGRLKPRESPVFTRSSLCFRTSKNGRWVLLLRELRYCASGSLMHTTSVGVSNLEANRSASGRFNPSPA